MRRRRFLLKSAASALVVLDLLFAAWRWHVDTAPNAIVTYVGLDSATLLVPVDASAATLRGNKWYADGQMLSDPAAYFRLHGREGLALVSLAPSGNLGQMIRSVRDLKERGICNVLIREGGNTTAAPGMPVPQLEISALALCGNALGDAGFHGSLPKDGPIHIDPLG